MHNRHFHVRFLSLCLFFSPSFLFAGGSPELNTSCRGPAGETLPAATARLSRRVLLDVLKYAEEHAHPKTGFVLDTVNNYGETPHSEHLRASISSTGFMMALVANLYVKGLVDRESAVRYCRRPLQAIIAREEDDERRAKAREISKASDPFTDISYRGWWSHFIDWSDGSRWEQSEYALTDSTWMLSGAIVCASTFPNTNIPKLVKRLYSQVNYKDLMTDGGAKPDKLTLSLAYTAPSPDGTPKEIGYSPLQWEIYQHSWLVYLLGMGSPNPDFALPKKSWAAWKRTGSTLDIDSEPSLDGKFLYGAERALFSHYFPDVFMPPQEIKEVCGINYFENSRMATQFNKAMALADTTSKTFKAGLWGLDAGPNPNRTVSLASDNQISVGDADTVSYKVNTPFKRNGTACPACAVAASMFDPELVFTSLKSWCADKNYGPKIWGNYGPANGINLDVGWIAPYALSGIVGPMALAVANLDEKTSVWRYFASYKGVKDGLAAAAEAPTPIVPTGSNPCQMPEPHGRPGPHNPHGPSPS